MRKKRNYWNYNRCKIVAKKCITKTEFHLNYSGAYDAAYKNNWLNEICQNMIQKKPKNYWNFTNSIIVAKKCKNRSEFQKNYPNAYHFLRKRNLLDKSTRHMSRPLRKRKWNKDNCINEAKKYKSISDWIKLGKGSYNVALRNNWNKECSKHMIVSGSIYKRLIYAFEFSDKNVYIGLTCNSIRRKNEHLNMTRKKKTTVYKHIEKTGLSPIYKELTDYMDKNIASIQEGEFVKKYNNSGWIVLNKRKTGELGSVGFKIVK